MVQTHQDSREEGTTMPISPQETEKIWHGSSDPPKVLQLHHREHPDCLHHRLEWQLLCLQPQHPTSQYITGAKLPAIQDVYTRHCQRKALKIAKDTSHLSHKLFSLLQHSKWYQSTNSRSKRLFTLSIVFTSVYFSKYFLDTYFSLLQCWLRACK